MRDGFVIILVTCPSRKEAGRIASGVLKARLAMCVNIISGVDSHFRWKGKIEKAKELILLIKARKTDFRAAERLVKKLHSYEVPEIVALPISMGSRDYMKWLKCDD